MNVELEQAQLTAAWRLSRLQRLKQGGTPAIDVEEAEYLCRFADLEVKRLEAKETGNGQGSLSHP